MQPPTETGGDFPLQQEMQMGSQLELFQVLIQTQGQMVMN